MAVDTLTPPTRGRRRALHSVEIPEAEEPTRGGRGAAAPPRIELQRARKLVTAAEAVRKFPFAGLADASPNGNGGISRDAFDEHLAGREAALLAAFEQSLALGAARASAAFQTQDAWVDRVRAGLLALLEFFDEEPNLARYLVVYSAQAGPSVLARRERALDVLARLLDDERAPARGYPPPLAAQAVVNGALGVLYGRLSKRDPGALIDLVSPLMSFIVLPFLGPKAARRELARPVAPPAPLQGASALAVLQHPGRQEKHGLSIRVLEVIAANPGLNSMGAQRRTALKDAAHASKLLTRLARLGLIEDTRRADRSARAKAWQLTASGDAVIDALRNPPAALDPCVAFDIPDSFVGRLDYRAVPLLRAVCDQPWLYTGELAERAGVSDSAEASELLAHLAALGLVESAREPRTRGTPKVWLPTAAGEELDRAIGREISPPPRSLVLELMWQTGGRLGDGAVSVLRVCAAEPGLGNREIALRVGISDENTTSQLLARLARRGLIENTWVRGRKNLWRLTAAGAELESAIRSETPAPVARTMTLDLLKDRGGRLNHRAVSVLRAIAAEPGISNGDLAERVGIQAKSHMSRILTRLTRLGVIENAVHDPALFETNAWRLTPSGEELVSVIRREDPDAGQ